MDWLQIFVFMLVFVVLLSLCSLAGYGIAKELVRKSCLVDHVDYEKEDETGCRCVAAFCFLFPPTTVLLLVIRSFIIYSEKYQKALIKKDLDKMFCFKIK